MKQATSHKDPGTTLLAIMFLVAIFTNVVVWSFKAFVFIALVLGATYLLFIL